jgi:hypothetical protein
VAEITTHSKASVASISTAMDEPPFVDNPELEADLVGYQRDEKIDQARDALQQFFRDNAQEVFYERQLTILFEDRFFHWITVKALHELARDGVIQTDILELSTGVHIRFFRSPTNRYWRRQANAAMRLVRRFSANEFLHAIGRHGELLVDAALPQAGFRQVSRNARSYQGRDWKTTQHDLDRIVEREGIGYGVEIKNTLPYIPKDELGIKLEMCRELGLVPLIVSRMAPKSYNYQIIQAGGISWILGKQFYPFGHEELARQVRTVLRLPVDSPVHIEDGAITRLVKAVEAQARRRPGGR